MNRRVRSVANETTGGLTTVERVKLELSISGNASDNLLALKIEEATSDIEGRCRPLRHATVVEEFWPSVGRIAPMSGVPPFGAPQIQLSRYPVDVVDSLVIDDETVDPSTYRVDADTGVLYLFDGSGAPIAWSISRLAVVTYAGGYVYPDDTGDSLPPVLESAAIDLLSLFWFSRGRDPMLKAEENPGVARFEYWVGAIGRQGDLPPSVIGKLKSFLKPPAIA